MKRLVFFIFTLSAYIAQAEQAFVAPEKLRLKPNYLEKILDATIEVASGCTGTYISNEGHILTALHCLEYQLPSDIKNRAQNYQYVRRWEYFFSKSKVYAPGRKIYPGNLHYINIDGKERESVKIIMTGKRVGVSHLDDKNAEDFAIIKVDVKQKVDCLPLRWQRPRSFDLAWVFGYVSGLTKRNGQSVSDGQSLVVSQGRISMTVAQASGRGIDTLRGEDKDVAMDEFLAGIVEYNYNTYSAKMDVDGGMSGGPVTDSNGQIIGVLSRAYTRLFSDRNNASFVHSQFINKMIEENLEPEDQEAIFSCGN